MKLMDRIRGFDQLQITLLAVLVSATISLGILAFYIYQGLTSDYFGYSDDYFEGDPASYGNLVFDILAMVLIAAVIILISLAIKKRQSRFLLIAVIFMIISLYLSQSSYGFISSVIICSIAYYYLKKEERDTLYQQSKTYLVKVVFSVYIMDVIAYSIPFAVYLFDTTLSMNTIDLTSYEFDGDVPDWMLWGAESTNAGINIFAFALYAIPFILVLIAAVFMYRAIRGQGNNSSKLGAALFLLYPLSSAILSGDLYSFFLALSSPEILLSIYILLRHVLTIEDLPAEKVAIGENPTVRS